MKIFKNLLVISTLLLTFSFSSAQSVQVTTPNCVYNPNTLSAGCTNLGNQSTQSFQGNSGVKYPELCSVFNRTLKVGDQGDDVKRLQIVLGQEGIAYLGGTGYYGPVTERAVKVFQTRAGIYAVGKVGPQTLARMRQLWCGPGTASTNPNTDTGSVVALTITPTNSSTNSLTLTWTSRNAVSCQINNQNVPVNGSQSYTIYNETEYTIACADSQNRIARKTILARPIGGNSNNIPQVNMSISPTNAVVGTYANLYWTSTNAVSCSLNGQVVPSNGSSQVYVQNTNSTYTIVCTSSTGQTVTQSLNSYGTSTNNNNNNGLQLSVTTDKTNYAIGENVIATLRVQNNSNTQATYQEPICSLYGPFTLTLNGQDFYSFLENNSRAVCLAYGFSTVTLQPYESKTYTYTGLIANKSFSTGNINLQASLANSSSNYQNNANAYFTINGSGSTNNNNISFTVITDKSNYNVGETMNITTTIINNNPNTITFTTGVCDRFNAKIDGYSYNDFFYNFNEAQYQPACTAQAQVHTLTQGQSESNTVSVLVKAYQKNGNVSTGSHTASVSIPSYTIAGTQTFAALSLNAQTTFTVGGSTSGTSQVSINNSNPNTGNNITITYNNTNYPTAQGAIFELVNSSGAVVGTISRLPGSFNSSLSSGAFSWTIPKSITDSRNDAISCQTINGETLCGNVIYSGQYKIRATYFTPSNYCLGFCANVGGQILGFSETPIFTINSTVGSSNTNGSVVLTPTSSTINIGQSVTIYSTATNVQSCNINGGIYGNQTLPTGSSYFTVSPSLNTTYTVTCVGNNGQSVTAQSYVAVNGTSGSNNVISSFSGFNNSGNVSLSWTGTGSNSCNLFRYSALGPSGEYYYDSNKVSVASNQPVSGNFSKAYSATTNQSFELFTLDCGGVKSNVAVYSSANTGTPTLSITPTSTTIARGNSATLNISTNNIASCFNGRLTSGNQLNVLNGQFFLAPEYTTLYDIKCNGTNGSTTYATIAVNVTNSPTYSTVLQANVATTSARNVKLTLNSTNTSCNENTIETGSVDYGDGIRPGYSFPGCFIELNYTYFGPGLYFIRRYVGTTLIGTYNLTVN